MPPSVVQSYITLNTGCFPSVTDGSAVSQLSDCRTITGSAAISKGISAGTPSAPAIIDALRSQYMSRKPII